MAETFEEAAKRLGIEEDEDSTQSVVFLGKRALDAAKRQAGQTPAEETPPSPSQPSTPS